MKIVLVLSDSFADCRKALGFLKDYAERLSAEAEVLVVLEDLYRLESASVSLGVPLPPDTVSSAKERTVDKVRRLWKKVTEDEEAQIKITTVAGEISEEVPKFLEGEKPDLLLWGCQPVASLCKIIERVEIPTLIIK